MKNKIFLIFISSIFFSSFSYGDTTKCLRYGVIPYVSVELIQKSYVKWKEYLEQEIGECIDISYESTYGSIIEKFSKDQLDMAFVGAFSYVLAKKVSDVEPIVSGVTRSGYATYKSYMVTTPKVASQLAINTRLSGEEGMEVLKQKLQRYKKKWMVAFTDESSTSGYAVPNYYMKRISLNPSEYFKKITLVGTHDAAQLVVKNNIIPIAFGAEVFYKNLLDKGDITLNTNKVIWESDAIPRAPIILKKELAKTDLKQRLQKALVNMPKEFMPSSRGREIGYKITDEKSYKIIENIHEYLQK